MFRLACVACVCASLIAFADSTEDLQRQIEQLRADIRELKAAPQNALTKADVDAAIAAVQADADRRAALLSSDSTLTGGYIDNKFVIRSADGNYSLSPGLMLQVRHNTTIREDQKHGDSTQTDDGFELRRMKVWLRGNLFNPDFTYFVLFAVDRKSGDIVDEESWVRYRFAPKWAIKLGQYKENITQEQAVVPRMLLAVDRSLMNELVNQGESFVQGVQIDYDNLKDFRALLGITDGYASRNNDFEDPPVNPFDFGVNGRIEYKFFGDWADYIDFRPSPKKDLLAASAAFDASQNGDITIVRHAADLQWKSDKLAATCIALGRYTTRGDGPDSYDWGLMGQGVYAINEGWDVFARYSFIHLDNPTVAEGVRHDYQEITVGFNRYFKSHFAKFTVDLNYLPNGSPTNQDGAGVLASKHEEFVIRAQFQFVL